MAQENKHTTGQVNNDLHDGNVYSGGIVVANCYSSLLMPETIKANAARFSKAWNEYESLQSKVKELEERNKVLEDALRKIDAISFHKNEWEEMCKIGEIVKKALSNNQKSKQ